MEPILLILLVLVFLGLPVLSMRKQSKQINQIKTFQSTLEPGMIVQMTSGIHARIAEVGETTVDVELAPGVTTTWDRSAVLKLVETPEGPEAPETLEESSLEDFDTVEPFENRSENGSSNPFEDREGGDDRDTPRS